MVAAAAAAVAAAAAAAAERTLGLTSLRRRQRAAADAAAVVAGSAALLTSDAKARTAVARSGLMAWLAITRSMAGVAGSGLVDWPWNVRWSRLAEGHRAGRGAKHQFAHGLGHEPSRATAEMAGSRLQRYM